MSLIKPWLHNFFQLIGILCWAVKIGRIDIYLGTTLLSQYQANPQFGHLEAAYHIFVYLKKHQDMGKLAFDSHALDIDESFFYANADWMDFYGDGTKELPPNIPELRGHPVIISAFVDAIHAGNIVTWCSHTSIFIFVQNAPITCFLKKQNTVKVAMFGSEFVALWICKEMIVAL
jgi:hypothetical protein